MLKSFSEFINESTISASSDDAKKLMDILNKHAPILGGVKEV